MMTELSSPSGSPNKWGAAVRPTLLFITAYMLNTTPHEAVHAVVTYCLGFGSTLFQMWVDPDTASASPGQQALIAGAGPVFSLALGTTCWLVYRRRKEKPSGLMFLLLAAMGIYIFLGNMFSAAFGGDFNKVLIFLGASPVLRYAVTVTGLVLLAVFLLMVGRELVGWAPQEFGRAKAVVCTTVVPWLIGTRCTVLFYLPLPKFFIAPTFAGSVFWVFAVLGAGLRRRSSLPHRIAPSINRWDVIIALAALIMVRLLVHGVRLDPGG